MKTLIVTADDFGNSIPINEAVEQGHSRGVLSAASLMVAGPAFEDAVIRARRLPRLGIGLHLTLVDGRPVLPVDQVSSLVGSDGRFGISAVKQGVALYFSPTMRRQARAEIKAQFERFHLTGLALDHVNGHQHFHMHPFVVSVLETLLPKYGCPPVRRPVEPFRVSYHAMKDRRASRLFNAIFFALQARRLKQLRHIGVSSNDALFGINDSGSMTATRIARYVKALPEGTSELYLHPATRRWKGPDNLPITYCPIEEFEALVDPSVLAAFKELAISPVSFAAAFAEHRAFNPARGVT